MGGMRTHSQHKKKKFKTWYKVPQNSKQRTVERWNGGTSEGFKNVQKHEWEDVLKRTKIKKKGRKCVEILGNIERNVIKRSLKHKQKKKKKPPQKKKKKKKKK